jgi:hypothetical protein
MHTSDGTLPEPAESGPQQLPLISISVLVFVEISQIEASREVSQSKLRVCVFMYIYS